MPQNPAPSESETRLCSLSGRYATLNPFKGCRLCHSAAASTSLPPALTRYLGHTVQAPYNHTLSKGVTHLQKNRRYYSRSDPDLGSSRVSGISVTGSLRVAPLRTHMPAPIRDENHPEGDKATGCIGFPSINYPISLKIIPPAYRQAWTGS